MDILIVEIIRVRNFFIHFVYKQDGLGKLFPEILVSYAKKCNFVAKYYKYP